MSKADQFVYTLNAQTGRLTDPINRTIQPATKQDHLSVADQQTTIQPFEFLAKYFSLSTLKVAEEKATNMGQEQAAMLFRKAAYRLTRVGGKGL